MNVMSPTLTARSTSQKIGSAYRGDIDGLRAIAVTAVVLFHAGVPGFSGGFAGVDIFFVISGYLIGGIVHREISEGRFSFAAFYARRARRILPALITVSAVTLLLGLLLLGPGELKQFAISAIAALVGVSNLWFLHSTDYFTPSAVLEPFLMTWSLGIEEQFYVLLPPLLLLMRRWSAPMVLRIVIIGAIASLLLALIATPVRPIEAFYLLPTRAWELGFGVALAIAYQTGFKVAPAVQPWLAAIGLAAIVAALTLFNEQTPFPGYAALLPTLGTLALIAAPDSGINQRVFASRPFVAIGQISYSWYLWHWPLLALYRVSASGPVPQYMLAIVAIASIVPAYCCWRWVELPWRHPRADRRDGQTLKRYGLALAACLLVLTGVAMSGGLPGRLGASGAQVQAILSAPPSPCLTSYGVDRPIMTPFCAPPGDGPLVALLGDSHAAAISDALRRRAQDNGYGLLEMTAASCPPLLGATLRMPEHPGASQACAAYNATAIERAANDPRVKLVVMTAFWQSPFTQRAQAIGEGVAESGGRFSDRSSEAELSIALGRTLARLQGAGKRVVVLGDVPWMRFNPAQHVWANALPLRGAIEHLVRPGLSDPDGYVDNRFFSALHDDGDRIVEETAKAAGVQHVRLRDILCPADGCRANDDTAPFFIDQQHLSHPGADYVLKRLDDEIWRHSR